MLKFSKMRTKTISMVLIVAAFSLYTAAQQGESGFKKIDYTDDEELQYRGYGDPLKGLDIANAKKNVVSGNYYGLVIGIDKYNGMWQPLKNAVNDARGISNTLKNRYKFEKIVALYDEKATRANIIEAFEWLVENVKDTDNVFIFYSGHGEFKQTLNKGYWVPVDAVSQTTAQYISNSDIQTFLGGIKSKHTLLVSDACFSGDLFRGKTVSIPFENSENYYQKVYDLQSRQALTSGGIEPVVDNGKDGHSIFTYYLLKALNNNDGRFFDANQLYENLRVPVINNSDQTPIFYPVKNTGDEGGQFVFIKK
jgi:uncharacterized caspase-like protein